MDPITIAAMVAMLGGAFMQQKASSDAASKQQKAIRESQLRQKEFQRQAEHRAMDTANSFTPEKREAVQTQIADQVTQNLIKPVAEVQSANDINSTAQGAVSQDYNQAKAVASLNQMKNAEALARLLGKTTSASRLRENEGIRVNDAGMDINRLNNFAQGQANADQLGIQVAGVPNPWLSMGGSLLQSAGGMALGSGGMSGPIGKLFGGAGKAMEAPIKMTSGGLTGFG